MSAAAGLPRPRLRIRTRLTLWYAGTFVAVGAVLLGIVWGAATLFTTPPATPAAPTTGGTCPLSAPPPMGHTLAAVFGAALVGCALVAVLIGWVVAGRMLAPISRITATAAAMATGTLHRRVDLGGPDDEIRQLAATFDTMLARLEAAFEAQQRFTANASHELLTPIAISRTLLEVAAADPDSPDGVRALAGSLLVLNQRSERLIDALLDLARARNGGSARTPVDLADVTLAAIEQATHDPVSRPEPVGMRTDVRSAVVLGDVTLLGQLAGNLIRNALLHNHPSGGVTVRLRAEAGAAVLTVTNDGPHVPSELVEVLFEPFVRARVRTAGSGHGLGLAIVHAVAVAHGGTVAAAANPGGGLTVEVHLPLATMSRGRRP